MKRCVALLGVLVLFTAVRGAATRHGVPDDSKSFSQATPKEALASVLKAIELKRYDYLLAQLADHDWVDARVAAEAGGFPELIKETASRLDPPTVKKLRKFLDEGEIETIDASAVFRLKDVKDRVVRFRKLNDRWYLNDASKP
jgi:hypothetical protein